MSSGRAAGRVPGLGDELDQPHLARTRPARATPPRPNIAGRAQDAALPRAFNGMLDCGGVGRSAPR